MPRTPALFRQSDLILCSYVKLERSSAKEFEVKRGTVESCTCHECVSACEHNPGWMSPADATRAIEAGHAGKLMLDWLEPCTEVGNKTRIFVLSPASDDRGGGMAPEVEEMHGFSSGRCFFGMWLGGERPYKGRCVYLKRGRCSIHASGFKPHQCRMSLGCGDNDLGVDNYTMAKMWRGREPRAVVAEWRRAVKAARATPRRNDQSA